MLRRRIKRVSRRAVALVAEFEGGKGADGRFHPYLDELASPAVWTIGYGDTENVRPKTRPWSARKAMRRLRRRLNRDYAPFIADLDLPLTQPMFDALASFIYNLGPGALARTTGVGRALRGRRWTEAANELLEWDKAGGRQLEGLARRRRAERHLFLSKLPS